MKSVWEEWGSSEFPETLEREGQREEFQEEEGRGRCWVLPLTPATVQAQRNCKIQGREMRKQRNSELLELWSKDSLLELWSKDSTALV